MPHRNPFDVLELPLDATTEAIRSAWRRLARQHHPDLTSTDEGLERRATRRMAEINAAYLELKDPASRRLFREEAARAGRGRARTQGGAAGHTGSDAAPGPDGEGATLRTRRSRPVTARIDTSALYRPRNATLHPQQRSSLPGHAPMPRYSEEREAPRASTPSGPTHRRPGPSLEGDLPGLGEALTTPIAFGKFAGLTVGDVADLEPTYLDWLVRTVSRDPELLLAARVALRHLEQRAEARRRRLANVPRG
jgi:curved DNA-binding protein CbpA